MSRAHRNYFNRIADSWSVDPLSEDLHGLLLQFGVVRGEKILDIGAGTGRVTRHLSALVEPAGQVVAADISEKMLLRAKSTIKDSHVAFICADACALSFRCCYFDKIICYATFPHIVNPHAALKEMYRVLKAGGKLLIFHSCCSRKLNRLHAALNGIVCRDQLPAIDEMHALVKMAGFSTLNIFEKPDLYWVEIIKP